MVVGNRHMGRFTTIWHPSPDINSRRINEIKPASFFRENKYTTPYDIMWRFVAGLLDAADEAVPFIDMI